MAKNDSKWEGTTTCSKLDSEPGHCVEGITFVDGAHAPSGDVPSRPKLLELNS